MARENQIPPENDKLKSELRTTLQHFLEVVDANSEILRFANTSKRGNLEDVFLVCAGRVKENVEIREKLQRRIAELV